MLDRFVEYYYATAEKRPSEDPANLELMLRRLSSLPRVARRFLGRSIIDIKKNYRERDVFARTHFVSEDIDSSDIAYVIIHISIPYSGNKNEYMQLMQSIYTAYGQKYFDRFGSLQEIIFLSLMTWVKKDKGNLYSEGLAYIHRSFMHEQDRPENDRVLCELGIEKLPSVFHRKEREYGEYEE